MDPLAMLSSLLRRSTQGEQTILELDLDFSVLSAPPENPLEALRALNAPTMRALRDGLREASADRSVLGLIVHLGTCPLTATQCDELGEALSSFGATKPVWAYTESFAEIGAELIPYLLATRASQIWLQPSGQVGLGGVRMQIMLARGVLDKLGVEPEFGKRQEYKSAADTYAAHEISEPNREMMQRIADSITEHAKQSIAQRRGLEPAAVADAFAAGPLRPQDALSRGLVDRIGYRDEVYAAARQAWATGSAKLRYVHRYGRLGGPAEIVAQRTKPGIAVIGVRGGIVSGRPRRPQGGNPVAAAEVITAQLRAAARDPQVKAVVLRVDSPGGSYIASDSIRREVQQVQASGRPVVASMGDLAASGGYFVAMPANEIVANPTTLTGSIGVLAGKFVIDQLKRKVGLVLADVASDPWATFMSPNQRFTPEQWDALNQRLDDIYADFTTKAAADRKLPLEVLEPVARGRVWTGLDAVERGLVDHLGGMELAIDRACALAGLSREAVTVRAVQPFAFLAQLKPAESSEALSSSVQTRAARLDLDGLVEVLGQRLGLANTGVLSLPFPLEVR